MARQLILPRRSLRLGALVAAAAVALMPTSALAATDSDFVSLQATDADFVHTLSVDTFDPALGTLQSVTLTLEGTVTGAMKLENTSTSSDGSGSVQLSASFTLIAADDPTLTLAGAALPADVQTFGLSMFDGAVDFAGGSGVSITGSATDVVSQAFDDPATLAAFTGIGEKEFVVEAVGTSFASGDTGNVESRFTTQAEATVTVSYEYVEAGLPAIQIEKTPDLQTVVVGNDAPFTITVTNTGPVDLVNVDVTDPLVADCDLFIGALAVGESTEYDCAAASVSEPFTNVAFATGEDDSGNQVDDDDDAVVEVGAILGVGAIIIEKTPDHQTVAVGSDVTFTITVTNAGPVDLVNVEVTDPLATDCDRYIGDLAMGASFSYDCVAPAVTQPFTNVATVTGEDRDGNGVTDSDDARVEVGDVLPLTGIDSSSIAIAGLILLSSGFGLVLLARRRTKPVAGLVVVFCTVLPMIAGTGGTAMAMELTEDHADTIPSMPTNWQDQFTFPQFDPIRGDLTHVTITFAGSMESSMAVENTSTSSSCLATLDWGGVYTLNTTDGEIVIEPTHGEAMMLSPFDGSLDYGGTSGASFGSLTAVDNEVVVITDPAALEAFTGTGDVELDVSARAATLVTGCGNISQSLATTAGAEATVSYHFEEAEAAPAIDIEKHTNGEDADEPTGPAIPVGDPVLWEYFVTNTGGVDLAGVAVSDDQGVAVTCPQDALAVGETMTCTGSGVAEEGQYANVGNVTGAAPDGTVVTDDDPSHYVGAMIITWLDCAHADVGCLGIAGEAPGPVEVFIDGVQVDCETATIEGSVLERFNCMFDSRFLPETVTVEIYAAGELLWVGTDLNTVCFESGEPPPDDPGAGAEPNDPEDERGDVSDERIEGDSPPRDDPGGDRSGDRGRDDGDTSEDPGSRDRDESGDRGGDESTVGDDAVGDQPDVGDDGDADESDVGDSALGESVVERSDTGDDSRHDKSKDRGEPAADPVAQTELCFDQERRGDNDRGASDDDDCEEGEPEHRHPGNDGDVAAREDE